MKNLILLFSTISIISCCISPKNKDNDLIKKTTVKYLDAIKNNDLKNYQNIIDGSNNIPGGIASDLFFLNKHYSKINPNDILYKTIKIKDTFNMGAHMKYVLYTLKKPHYKPFETNKDLRLYLFFWKKIGYDKIFQASIIGDIPEWEDQKSLDLNN